MLRISRKSNTDNIVAALFIYAPIIVDFYRKINSNILSLPLETEIVRNIIYIMMFITIMWRVYNKRQYTKLIIISLCFASIVLLSYLINPYSNTENLYLSVILMFFSRLLPAYYLGRYVLCGQEQEFVQKVASLSWISLIYSVFVLIYPEVSIASYITISNNLILPCAICFLASNKLHMKIIYKAIALIGIFVIIVYGGRGTLVSLLLMIFLNVLVVNRKERSVFRWFVIILLMILAVLALIYYKDIAHYLLKFDPTSRTLKLISKGELLWSSGRDIYYEAAMNSFTNNPFRIYGLLGDRFYFAECFGGYQDYSMVFSMFSHNMIIELMLCFGVFPGLAIAIWAIVLLIKAYKSAVTIGGIKNRLYTVLLAATIVPALVSTSIINDYAIWLLIGIAIAYTQKKHELKHSNIHPGLENIHVNT